MQTSIQQRSLSVKRRLFDKAFEELNERQREAVFSVNNPLLILAGAGSGKTTVLVRRIAFIIRYGNAYFSDYVPYGTDDARIAELERAMMLQPEAIREHILPQFANNACEPYRVLAITFTNKAANEIKERLSRMFPDEEHTATDIWAGTFHSVCARILRVDGDRLGYEKDFTIYDTTDTKNAVSEVMKQLNIDEKTLPIKTVLREISRAKESLMDPDAFEDAFGVKDFRLKQVAKIYRGYSERLKGSNAVDFDDMIMLTVRLLSEHEDVRTKYQKKFRYVSVDEFQDTNAAQLRLTALL